MVYAVDDGPFGATNARDSGDSTPLGVGFSDAALLIVSLCGFALLGAVVYALVLARLKSNEELEADARRELDYDEYLLQANVANLTRAELKARARALARQQDCGGRRERQKLAKDIEKEERRLFADQRREQQLAIQETALKSRRERELLEAKRAEEERKIRAAELEAERNEYLTFLATEKKHQAVDEWIEQLETAKGSVVNVHDVAEEFGLPWRSVRDRIHQLVDEKRLLGVFESDGRFVHIRESDVHSLLCYLRSRDEISNAEISDLWNTSIVGGQDIPFAATDDTLS